MATDANRGDYVGLVHTAFVHQNRAVTAKVKPEDRRTCECEQVESLVPLAPVDFGVEALSLTPQAGNTFLRLRLFTSDVLATIISWVVVGFVLESGGSVHRLESGLAAMLGTLVAMRLAGLYRSHRCARRSGELSRILVASAFGAGLFAVVQWSVATPGPQAAICALVCVLMVSVLRWHYGRWLRQQRGKGRYVRRVLMVGTNQDAALLSKMLSSEPELGYEVVGVVGDHREHPSWDGLPRAKAVGDLPALARSTGVSGVVVVPNALTNGDVQRAIRYCTGSGLHVQVWPGFFGVGSRRLRHAPIAGEPFFYVGPKSTAVWQRAGKRTMDVLGATIGILISAPIVAVAALATKVEGGGPILHRQQRVGLNGAPFTMFKLRTMVGDTGDGPSDLAPINVRTDGPLFKASVDPRVTNVGRFLRALSIDELPQLYNVLQGKMSLVGPRPALPHEAAQFDPEFLERHSMRPGVTGLWQIEARENPSFNAYRRLDLHYVENWSLVLDISILLTTIPAVGAHALRAMRKSPRRKPA